MSQVLPDDEIAENINSFNSKQREIFNLFQKSAEDYVKCNGHNVEPVHICLSGGGAQVNRIW